MSKENNKMQVDIENLIKQNVNDLSAIKELYIKLNVIQEKISQIKYIDSTLTNKLKKEYEKLKKIILDENIQAKLTNDIETINEKLNNDIETINSQLNIINAKINNTPVKITEYEHYKNGEDWAPVFNYLTNNGFRNIEVPSGTYKLLTPANLVSGLRIFGQFGSGFTTNGKTILQVTSTAFTFPKEEILTQKQEVTIENLVFKGGTNVIDFALCHIVTVKNCSFIDFSNCGIILTRGERNTFENINFWAQSKSFNIAFAFADKTLSTHDEIKKMNFGVDGEWVDRLTIERCTTMMGSSSSYNYSLWGGNKLSHSTIHNFYCHGGLVSVLNVKTLQQCDLFNWVMDGWGTINNPCENLINITKQAIDTNFTSISPAFAGNNKTITQFYINGGQGLTIQSCYANGDNNTTFGFKLGNSVGQNITFIGCRGAFYSGGSNDLIRNQINHVGCSYSISNSGANNIFNGNGLNEVHTLMNDTNGATKSSGAVKYLYARGSGNVGTMLEFGENIIKLGHSGIHILTGNGNPNNIVAAPMGSIYFNKDGGTNTTIFVKESGSADNTGWVAK